jgi:hypothetical protein
MRQNDRLTTAKRIPLSTIDDASLASLITFDASSRLVIPGNGVSYDSFAAFDGTGKVNLRAGTVELHDAPQSEKIDSPAMGREQRRSVGLMSAAKLLPEQCTKIAVGFLFAPPQALLSDPT